jgi:hypothetical protein
MAGSRPVPCDALAGLRMPLPRPHAAADAVVTTLVAAASACAVARQQADADEDESDGEAGAAAAAGARGLAAGAGGGQDAGGSGGSSGAAKPLSPPSLKRYNTMPVQPSEALEQLLHAVRAAGCFAMPWACMGPAFAMCRAACADVCAHKQHSPCAAHRRAASRKGAHLNERQCVGGCELPAAAQRTLHGSSGGRQGVCAARRERGRPGSRRRCWC